MKHTKTKRIMVADDDAAIVDAIRMILEFGGYEVITVQDGRKVLGMSEPLPDLLLLDIWMSGEDGKQICKKLKNQPSTRHIPIIIISATRDVHSAALEAGANDFIAKPFEMDELLAKVGEQLVLKM